MSVFLMPDGDPFYAGTYFPPDVFKTVLTNVVAAFDRDYLALKKEASAVAEAVRSALNFKASEVKGEPDIRVLANYLEQTQRTFDWEHGGFGGAPKFPPGMALPLLLWVAQSSEQPVALQMALKTLREMALGGFHDLVGGGFHRYSTDRGWFVPHFEKMLTDNALLIRAYAEAWSITGEPVFRLVAEAAADWALREMRLREGAFACSIDADSEGEEGRFYTWTVDEIREVLPDDSAIPFCKAFGALKEGNYLEEATGEATGRNILRAESFEALPSFMSERRALLEARDRRPRPLLDDKALTGWNGLMIGALAYAGGAFDRTDYIDAAQLAADFVWQTMKVENGLLRRYRDGEAGISAFLEDYALFGGGLVALAAVTKDLDYLRRAETLADEMIEQFADTEHGGFFNAGSANETLIARSKAAHDSALPCGNGAATMFLAHLALVTDEPRYRQLALEAAGSVWNLILASPQGSESLLYALAMLQQGGVEIQEAVPVPQLEGGVIAPNVRLEPDAIVLELLISEGWRVYAPGHAPPNMTPLQATFSTDLPLELQPAVMPLAQREGDFAVYKGELAIRAPFAVATDANVGEGRILIELTYQACSDNACLAPLTLNLVTRVAIGE